MSLDYPPCPCCGSIQLWCGCPKHGWGKRQIHQKGGTMTEILTEEQVATTKRLLVRWFNDVPMVEWQRVVSLIASHRALQERVKELEAEIPPTHPFWDDGYHGPEEED